MQYCTRMSHTVPLRKLLKSNLQIVDSRALESSDISDWMPEGPWALGLERPMPLQLVCPVLTSHVTRDMRPLRCREPGARFYRRVQHRWWPHFGHALRLLECSYWCLRAVDPENDPGYLCSLTHPEPCPESPRTLPRCICSVYAGR